MSTPDYKNLKKLADACRKAGIKSFKNAELEFTLTDAPPISNYKKREAKPRAVEFEEVKDESLTDEQLLFWSIGDMPSENSGNAQ